MDSINLDQMFSDFLSAFGKVLIICAIVSFVIYVLSVIARWKIFQKMGESGWKSIIPIYNTIVLYDNVWTTSVFWFSIFISFFGGIAGGVLKLFQLGILSNANTLMGYLYNGCLYFDAGVGAILLILGIIYTYKFSKAFGHGFLFALGLLICPRLFEFIIAFGKSEFEG